MIANDLDKFCSPGTSPTTKCLVLQKILKDVSGNYANMSILYNRFTEVCGVLFGVKGKGGLIRETRVASELRPLLDPFSSTFNLPSIIRESTQSVGGFIETSSPYFVLDATLLPTHVQELLEEGEIEFLPPFFRDRVESFSQDPVDPKPAARTAFSTQPVQPEFEIRLDVLEYYLYWFIRYPLLREDSSLSSDKRSTTSKTTQPSAPESKPLSSKLFPAEAPSWMSKLTDQLSPQKQRTPPPSRVDSSRSAPPSTPTNLYLELLALYLKAFLPRDISQNASLPMADLIVEIWLNYGKSSPRQFFSGGKKRQLRSKSCLEAIREVVVYLVSDAGLDRMPQREDHVMLGSAASRMQKPLYDFLMSSFDICSEYRSKGISELVDVWTAFLLPWRQHESATVSPDKPLAEHWILYVQQNILFYLEPTERFLEFIRTNVNTASREADLVLIEKFITHFRERNLYRHIREVVYIIEEIRSGGLYTSQSLLCGTIQRHCAKMEVNLSHFTPLFSEHNPTLPEAILRNMCKDIEYCVKYLNNSEEQRSRIMKASEQFASIFALSSYWREVRPLVKSGRTRSRRSRNQRDGGGGLRRPVEVAYRGQYWNAPLMSHENPFLARQAYQLATYIQQNYQAWEEEPPHIRWIASYHVMGTIAVTLVVLYILWKLAVLLTSS